MTTAQVIALFLVASGGAHLGLALGMVGCPRKPPAMLIAALLVVGAGLLAIGIRLITK